MKACYSCAIADSTSPLLRVLPLSMAWVRAACRCLLPEARHLRAGVQVSLPLVLKLPELLRLCLQETCKLLQSSLLGAESARADAGCLAHGVCWPRGPGVCAGLHLSRVPTFWRRDRSAAAALVISFILPVPGVLFPACAGLCSPAARAAFSG